MVNRVTLCWLVILCYSVSLPHSLSFPAMLFPSSPTLLSSLAPLYLSPPPPPVGPPLLLPIYFHVEIVLYILSGRKWVVSLMSQTCTSYVHVCTSSSVYLLPLYMGKVDSSSNCSWIQRTSKLPVLHHTSSVLMQLMTCLACGQCHCDTVVAHCSL